MNIKGSKPETQKILQHEHGKTLCISLLSAFFSLVLFAAVAFSLYTLTVLPAYTASVANPLLSVAYYALFSCGVIFSLFFLSMIQFNKKRWFLENAVRCTRADAFFRRERLGLRMRAFYLYLFKKAMALLTLLLFETPFFICAAVLWYSLENRGIYRSVAVIALSLAAALFIAGIYFAAVSFQRYALCEQLLFCNKKMTVVEAVAKSRALTDGHKFKIWNYKLSFSLWAVSCLLAVPAFYVFPYINQAYGSLSFELLKDEDIPALSAAPIIFMKPADAKQG